MSVSFYCSARTYKNPAADELCLYCDQALEHIVCAGVAKIVASRSQLAECNGPHRDPFVGPLAIPLGIPYLALPGPSARPCVPGGFPGVSLKQFTNNNLLTECALQLSRWGSIGPLILRAAGAARPSVVGYSLVL